MRIIKSIFIFPIRLYQALISPWLGKNCRHAPTCSQYAIEAIQVHGVLKGLVLAANRIRKCHPWGTAGYDPVPPKKQ
jgi:putative membrane protein insertion efficiency factor